MIYEKDKIANFEGNKRNPSRSMEPNCRAGNHTIRRMMYISAVCRDYCYGACYTRFGLLAGIIDLELPKTTICSINVS